MRARNIKPGFFKNEQLAELPVEARLLFAGLWCMADREGRLEDRPKRIKMEIFPADGFDVDDLLDHLAMKGLIVRYQSGKLLVIQVVEFLKHQHPHQKEPPSILPKPWDDPVPAPDKPGAGPGAARLIPDSGFSDSGSLIPDSGSLIPENRKPGPHTGKPGNVSRETSEALAPGREIFDGVQFWDFHLSKVYPREVSLDERQKAGRKIEVLVSEGHATQDLLILRTTEFQTQQKSAGNLDTDFVMNPAKFFDVGGRWMGPFPIRRQKTAARAVDRLKFDPTKPETAGGA